MSTSTSTSTGISEYVPKHFERPAATVASRPSDLDLHLDVSTKTKESKLLNVFSLLNFNPSSTIFETSIDLTPERLEFIFHSFDGDSDGKISYEALRKGISVWADDSETNLDDHEFKDLCNRLDADQSGDITMSEFENGLRMIALRRLFHVNVKGSPMVVRDYDSVQLVVSAIQTSEEHHSFHTGKRKEWVKNRWIDATVGIDEEQGGAITLQRLAVKYQLHPLAVEDALETKQHRPKVEQYSTHLSIFLPIVSLKGSVMEGADEDNGSAGSAGSAAAGTATATKCCRCFRRASHTNSHRPVPRTSVDMVSIFVNVPRNDTLITFRNSGNKRKDIDAINAMDKEDVWSRIKQGLNKTYSKLRQYDCQYLLYGILDASVDLIPPLVEQMTQLIKQEKHYLLKSGYRNLDRVNEIREELSKIIRQLKPFHRVLIHVIEDDAICKGATIYLQDVKDNLECCVDDLKELLVTCDGVSNDFEKFHQGSMDRTLYLMTVVTSIFLPAQFLTGVWGMNFVSMPELQTEWVYPLFWVFTILFTIVMLYLFDCGRLNR